MGRAQRKASKKLQGNLSEEMESSGLVEVQVDSCGKRITKAMLSMKYYSGCSC